MRNSPGANHPLGLGVNFAFLGGGGEGGSGGGAVGQKGPGEGGLQFYSISCSTNSSDLWIGNFAKFTDKGLCVCVF